MKWIIWFILMIIGSFAITLLCGLIKLPTEISSMLGMVYGFMLTIAFLHL